MIPATREAQEERLAQLKFLRSQVEAEIKALEKWLRRKDAARPIQPAANVPAATIRAWLRRRGHQIGDRGRISYEMRREYVEAHR